MKTLIKSFNNKIYTELGPLCSSVRKLVCTGDYQTCEHLITSAMSRYPDAPEPHNLLGILLESEGDHLTAMKHFRAAWALDPSYLPARLNMDNFGTLSSYGIRGQNCAFDESDCGKALF